MNTLTVNDYAALVGCGKRHVQKQLKTNSIPGEKIDGIWQIPLSSLDATLQKKWYQIQGISLPSELATVAKATQNDRQVARVFKPLEFYTARERDKIEELGQLLQKWHSFRNQYPGLKKEADAAFIREERLGISVKTLYRYQKAYKAKDWDALLDQRGKANRGKSEFSQEIRELFEYFYLDERAVNIRQCYLATRNALKKEMRFDLLDCFPSYETAYRWAKAVPLPIACLARDGGKAFDDQYGLYVDRIYDDMLSNDFWIADGHRIDVITVSEDGKERRHRMTLTAFIDARSGIYVGWVITENPSTEATLLALRKAITRYGIPRYIYVDNGREYLNIDVGGMGHRTRKRRVKINLPTPILSRLGIQMTNALPRNARAKIIEREFKNFTYLSSLFPTYCGSSVVTKPEKLKKMLKAGRIPTDGELYEVVTDMIDGYFNCQEYNGKVAEDRGLPKIQVYHDNLPRSISKAPPEELRLMMMRSTRQQTVGRNGVHITVCGEKVFYYDDALLDMQGQKVFVRYDPEVMTEVHVYDEQEAFLRAVPLHPEMMQTYFANQGDIKAAMSEQRRYKKRVKQEIETRRAAVVARYGNICMLDLQRSIARENRQGILLAEESSQPAINLVRSEETQKRLSATGTDGVPGVVIDKKRVIESNERRQRT